MRFSDWRERIGFAPMLGHPRGAGWVNKYSTAVLLLAMMVEQRNICLNATSSCKKPKCLNRTRNKTGNMVSTMVWSSTRSSPQAFWQLCPLIVNQIVILSQMPHCHSWMWIRPIIGCHSEVLKKGLEMERVISIIKRWQLMLWFCFLASEPVNTRNRFLKHIISFSMLPTRFGWVKIMLMINVFIHGACMLKMLFQSRESVDWQTKDNQEFSH